MTARIHHYVPKLYLRGFSCDRKRRQVHVVDAIEKCAFVTNIQNVAAERDFNRLELDGVEPDALEVGFNDFETQVAAAIDRTCERDTFRDEEDRALIFNLIGLMATRNPRLRETMSNFTGRVVKMMMDIVLAEPERFESQMASAKKAGFMKAEAKADYAEVKAFHESGKYKIKVRREAQIALELSTHEKILPYIFDRKWTLLRAMPDAGQFITSDHPVCLMFTDPELYRPRQGIGYGLAKTEVLFPLAAGLALSGTFEGEEREFEADIITVANCNAAIIAHAERQVYACAPDFPYLCRGPMPFARGKECLSDGSFVRPRGDEAGA
jgi:chemotaxis regulatin CheY-phosphate phosphatase CheZ